MTGFVNDLIDDLTDQQLRALANYWALNSTGSRALIKQWRRQNGLDAEPDSLQSLRLKETQS